MADVLFDYKYVVQGDIIALLISIVTHCLLKSTYMAKKANLGIFKFANKLMMVAAVSSIFYHHMIFLLRPENIVRLYFCIHLFLCLYQKSR